MGQEPGGKMIRKLFIQTQSIAARPELQQVKLKKNKQIVTLHWSRTKTDREKPMGTTTRNGDNQEFKYCGESD